MVAWSFFKNKIGLRVSQELIQVRIPIFWNIIGPYHSHCSFYSRYVWLQDINRSESLPVVIQILETPVFHVIIRLFLWFQKYMVARYFKNNRCSSMSLSGCLPKFEFKYFLNLIHVVTFHMSQVLFFWFQRYMVAIAFS